MEGDSNHRYEIIDGELFVTRSPHWKHQAICIKIGTGHLTGAPELIVEVLSSGEKNEHRDLEAKLKLYSVQEVLEYWIVDRKVIN